MDDLKNVNADKDCFITLKRWLENRNNNKWWGDYLKACGYKKICIYGAGDIGHLFYEEIKNTDIEVKFFVDRNAEGISEIDGIPVILFEQLVNGDYKYEDIDIMIISPVGAYAAISKMLARTIPELPSISLRDAVYEV